MSIKVKQFRVAKGFSVQQAAIKARMTASMWTKVERGERRPSLETACRMARALGVPLDALFNSESTNIRQA